MDKIPYNKNKKWKVRVHKKAAKRADKMPANVKILFAALIRDLEIIGPDQHEWPNYSKLPHGRYHCHLNYSNVAVWEIVCDTIRILEVIYVGSRESAPY